MHYYSQFSEREIERKALFLFSLCLAPKVEILGSGYSQ